MIPPVKPTEAITFSSWVSPADGGYKEVLRITVDGELIFANATEAAEALKREWDKMRPQAAAVWLPLADAPRNGKMVWLLVEYGAYGEHPLADASRAATIGFNNHDHDEDWPADKWQFVGWNWEQDCFCNHATDNHKLHVVAAWCPIGLDLEQEAGEEGSPIFLSAQPIPA